MERGLGVGMVRNAMLLQLLKLILFKARVKVWVRVLLLIFSILFRVYSMVMWMVIEFGNMIQ